jgi:hypothetical protein
MPEPPVGGELPALTIEYGCGWEGGQTGRTSMSQSPFDFSRLLLVKSDIGILFPILSVK